MLSTVRIQRFKSIQDATLQLGRITVLVGPNNAGKSSVLQAVQFCVSVAQSLKLDGTASWRDDALAGSLSTQQLIYTPLRDVQALASGGTLRQGDESSISVEFTMSGGDNSITTVKRGKNRNIAIKVSGEKLGLELTDIEAPFSVVSPGLAGIPSYEEYKSPGLVRRAAARGDANSVFRNVLWTLKQDPPGWKRFVQSLAEVFNGVEIDVTFNERTDEHIDAVVIRDGTRLPIDAAGTGVLQAIQVLAYVSVYKPQLLVLDEPDSHLHPDNQRKLMRLLSKEAEEHDFQVLMSSHSRHIIDEAGTLGSQVIWFSDGAIQDESFDNVKALIDLGALDAGDRLRGGATRVIVLTEDDNFDWLTPILESSGLTHDQYDIWSYKGCTNVKSAVVLAAFIGEHAPGTRVVVHRDRDYLADAEVDAYIADILAGGAIPFLPEGTMIESCYLRLDHLSEVFPEVDKTILERCLDLATESVRKYSIKTLINETDRYQNLLRKAGVKVKSAGTISEESPGAFDADPVRYRHGKKAAGALQQQIQSATTFNRKLNVASPALSLTPFTDIVADLDAVES